MKHVISRQIGTIKPQAQAMHIVKETLDDALRELYPILLASKQSVMTSRGSTRELIGILIEITKPRARLSRSETRGKPFSCLGELCWYLAGENKLDFITHYIADYANESDDGKTVHGAYGPRLFGPPHPSQIENIIALLREKPNTRRAVIQLFNAEDVSTRFKEAPCTTTLQFLLRDQSLNLIATMRSNDAYMGLPHDIFCFTMLQEIIARSLNAEIGIYRHFVGSMHIYDDESKNKNDVPKVELYLNEAVQPRTEMPEMPHGDPWPALKILLATEKRIRENEVVDIGAINLDAYWLDLLRLLQVFAARGDDFRIDELKSALHFRKYGSYIQARKGMPPRKEKPKPSET